MSTPKKKQKSHAAAGGQQAQQQATVEFITKVLLWGSWQDVCSTWMSICTTVATMGPYVCALVQLHARPGAVHMQVVLLAGQHLRLGLHAAAGMAAWLTACANSMLRFCLTYQCQKYVSPPVERCPVVMHCLCTALCTSNTYGAAMQYADG
jgi:hypothetical protein